MQVDEDEDSEVDEIVERIHAAHAKAKNLSAIHPPPQLTSEVMGARHLAQGCEVDDLRDSRISALQATMNSPDKKRLARYLATLSFSLSDAMAVLTRSALMFPFRDVATLARSKNRVEMEDLWQKDQELVCASLESLQEKLRGYTAHLHLANDKMVNPYWFATVDRMEHAGDLEKVATKAEMEAFKAALTAQDKSAANKKKRARPAKNNNGKNKKRKANADNKPQFARCAACNKLGHVEGDARCKAAPKPAAT